MLIVSLGTALSEVAIQVSEHKVVHLYGSHIVIKMRPQRKPKEISKVTEKVGENVKVNDDVKKVAIEAGNEVQEGMTLEKKADTEEGNARGEVSGGIEMAQTEDKGRCETIDEEVTEKEGTTMLGFDAGDITVIVEALEKEETLEKQNSVGTQKSKVNVPLKSMEEGNIVSIKEAATVPSEDKNKKRKSSKDSNVEKPKKTRSATKNRDVTVPVMTNKELKVQILDENKTTAQGQSRRSGRKKAAETHDNIQDAELGSEGEGSRCGSNNHVSKIGTVEKSPAKKNPHKAKIMQ
jgi:hypothetical protein